MSMWPRGGIRTAIVSGVAAALRQLGRALPLAALTLLGPAGAAQDDGVRTSYGYAVFGELKYGPGYRHFDYVDPAAPKGGNYRFASQGASFDSLNQIALLGTIPASVMFMTDTLMKQSRDEPASYYCLCAARSAGRPISRGRSSNSIRGRGSTTDSR